MSDYPAEKAIRAWRTVASEGGILVWHDPSSERIILLSEPTPFKKRDMMDPRGPTLDSLQLSLYLDRVGSVSASEPEPVADVGLAEDEDLPWEGLSSRQWR